MQILRGTGLMLLTQLLDPTQPQRNLFAMYPFGSLNDNHVKKEIVAAVWRSISPPHCYLIVTGLCDIVADSHSVIFSIGFAYEAVARMYLISISLRHLGQKIDVFDLGDGFVTGEFHKLRFGNADVFKFHHLHGACYFSLIFTSHHFQIGIGIDVDIHRFDIPKRSVPIRAQRIYFATIPYRQDIERDVRDSGFVDIESAFVLVATECFSGNDELVSDFVARIRHECGISHNKTPLWLNGIIVNINISDVTNVIYI